MNKLSKKNKEKTKKHLIFVMNNNPHDNIPLNYITNFYYRRDMVEIIEGYIARASYAYDENGDHCAKFLIQLPVKHEAC